MNNLINIQTSDLIKEMGQNFIEYAVACNTDRAIPDATSGLKPVAKRILYGAYDQGFASNKPHVKCANIVGNVMADLHPHGDSSIYGALVRLAQPWVMRYPLIDFHGSMGNRDGDGPAAYRYTEARLSKLAEDGMLKGIKKNNVDYIPNYSETKDEPITLPSLFPNLLCNPNSGIGVALACSWLPHNLIEVAQAIYDYMDGLEPMLPGPDFPTGGIIINGDEMPNIVKNGKGTVKLRGKYKCEDNNIIFYEIPYGITTESLMEEISVACENGKLFGIKNIRNESNKKVGFRLVIECEKNATLATIINLLFKETSLQTSISYNQVALVNKSPVELTLLDCIKIYVEHNIDCIIRETNFDKEKTSKRLEIVEGLLKALEDINNIIELIKKSETAAVAKEKLQTTYNFTEAQAHAIVEMKLGRLAGLEQIELQKEAVNLKETLQSLQLILNNPSEELKKQLKELVNVYGDSRRTEITNITISKEDLETVFVEPEKCVVVMTEGGLIKRVAAENFKTQKRNGKGIKTQDDITNSIIRTNTVDSLMIFSNKGKMYRLLVNNIPEGTNITKGQPIKALVNMEADETPAVIYSIYKDTNAKFVFFATKNGTVKKTSLEEFMKTRKKSGLTAINFREDDELVSVSLIEDEEILLITREGMCIRFNSQDIGVTGRNTIGVKGINLKENDYVVAALPIRDKKDSLAIFTENGMAKKISLKEFGIQKRSGKGIMCYRPTKSSGLVQTCVLISDEDKILICGKTNSICISAEEITEASRVALGVQVIKNNTITSVSKV